MSLDRRRGRPPRPGAGARPSARCPTSRPDPDRAWQATEAAWRTQRAPAARTPSRPRDARHSYAVLRGLTSSGGGMVAAATMSLPERGRAGPQLRLPLRLDPRPVLRRAGRRRRRRRTRCWTTPSGSSPSGCSPTARSSRPPTPSTAAPVPDQRQLDLPGYPGGTDIVGNHVNDQFQLDAFGEALLLFAAAARHDRLDAERWHAAADRRRAPSRRAGSEPDAGIWELDDRALGALPADLRGRAARHRRSAAPRPEAAGWAALADAILADTAADCLHPDGRWQRAPRRPAGRRRAAAARACAAPCPPTTPARVATLRRRRRRARPRTATSTGSGTTTARSARPRARSCSAGS